MNFRNRFWKHLPMHARPEVCKHPKTYTCQSCRNGRNTNGHMDHN